jgi:hypothetical protein
VCLMLNSPGPSPVPSERRVQTRTSIRRDEQVLSKAVQPGLKGKIFSQGVGGHFEVVNQRVLDSGKQACGDGFVCRMVEIRTQGLYVVEFKNRYVGEIETRQRFVRSSDSQATANACAADHRDVVECRGPRLENRMAVLERYFRPEAKQHDVRDQRRGPLGNLPCG